MDQFEERNIKEFSMIVMFAVTGACCLLFSLMLKVLDGSYSPLFNKIGFISLGLFVICIFIKWAIPAEKKQQKELDAIFEK